MSYLAHAGTNSPSLFFHVVDSLTAHHFTTSSPLFAYCPLLVQSKNGTRSAKARKNQIGVVHLGVDIEMVLISPRITDSSGGNSHNHLRGGLAGNSLRSAADPHTVLSDSSFIITHGRIEGHLRPVEILVVVV